MSESTRESKVAGSLFTNLIAFKTKMTVARQICEAAPLSTDTFLMPIRKNLKSEVNPETMSDIERFYQRKQTDPWNPPLVLREFTKAVILSKRVPSFLNEMCLSYLVSVFEDLLCADIRDIYAVIPQMLKMSDKTISLGNLVDFATITEMRKALIEREISGLTRGGIEDFQAYFKSKMQFDIEAEDWNDFTEFFFRRNLLVHNDLVPDDEYVKKTMYQGDRIRLPITDEYLDTGFRLFENYAESITKQLHLKFCKDLAFVSTDLVIKYELSELQSRIRDFVDTGKV